MHERIFPLHPYDCLESMLPLSSSRMKLDNKYIEMVWKSLQSVGWGPSWWDWFDLYTKLRWSSKLTGADEASLHGHSLVRRRQCSDRLATNTKARRDACCCYYCWRRCYGYGDKNGRTYMYYTLESCDGGSSSVTKLRFWRDEVLLLYCYVAQQATQN